LLLIYYFGFVKPFYLQVYPYLISQPITLSLRLKFCNVSTFFFYIDNFPYMQWHRVAQWQCLPGKCNKTSKATWAVLIIVFHKLHKEKNSNFYEDALFDYYKHH